MTFLRPISRVVGSCHRGIRSLHTVMAKVPCQIGDAVAEIGMGKCVCVNLSTSGCVSVSVCAHVCTVCVPHIKINPLSLYFPSRHALLSRGPERIGTQLAETTNNASSREPQYPNSASRKSPQMPFFGTSSRVHRGLFGNLRADSERG